MRYRRQHSRMWLYVGTMLTIALPLAGVLLLRMPVGVAGYVIQFGATVTLAHIGLAVKHYAVIPALWVTDLIPAVIMGAGAWLATRLSEHAGGGPVDPALLALLGTWFLLLWPSVRRV